MNDSERWRRFISIWVAATCLTALISSWLLSRPTYRAARYEIREFAGRPYLFDRHDAKLHPLVPELREIIEKTRPIGQ